MQYKKNLNSYPDWDFLCSDRSKFNLMRWWILVIVTFLGINSDKITKSKDLSIKVIWEIILMEMKKSARRRHCSKIFKTNLKTHISPLLNPHCSRITRYPSFISQDFFHFSSFINNGDNLNMYENLRFHREFFEKTQNL